MKSIYLFCIFVHRQFKLQYKEKLEQRRNTMQSTKSVKSNFSHTTIVDEQMFNDMKLPKISISASSDHLRRCSNIIEECEDYPSLPTKVKKVR